MTKKIKLSRLTIIIVICMTLLVASFIVIMLFVTHSSSTGEPQITIKQSNDEQELVGKSIKAVNSEIIDKQLGYTIRATRVIIGPFVDKESVTDSDETAVLVKYIIAKSDNKFDGPSSGGISLKDANDAELLPVTTLVEDRMKKLGYRPGVPTIEPGEIGTGYEAYFVKKDALSSLKMQYTRPALKKLNKKVFTARLY